MKFYTLGATSIGPRSQYALGLILGDVPSRVINCPVCGRTWKELQLTSFDIPLRAMLYGRRIPDATWLFSVVIFKTLVLDNLRDKGLSGIIGKQISMVSGCQASSAELEQYIREGYSRDRMVNSPPEFSILIPEVGINLHPESQVELREQCEVCGYTKYSTIGASEMDPFAQHYLDLRTWNGNDVFRVREWANAVVCTERFVNEWKRGKYTGLDFSPMPAL